MVIALGSNLSGEYGSSEALLKAAVTAIEAAGFDVLAQSRWWRSASWPDATKPDYLNGVLLARTEHSPEAALEALHQIEASFGRTRIALNDPRPLDLDLVAYGRRVGEHPSTPHPRSQERRFVMGPLAEVAPGWVHPVLGKAATELAAGATVGTDAHPI